MNENTPDVNEAELHAYVDGQLPAERREAMARAIEADPALAEAARAYAAQNAELRARFGGIIDEPVPERLHPKRIAAKIRRRRWVAPVAASVVWFAVGLGGGWTMHDQLVSGTLRDPGRQVVREAVSAHRLYTMEVLHPVEVAAAEEEHLVKWLSKRLGYPIRIPDLSSLGFQLIGGRLLPVIDGGPAAQFMFEDRSNRRLTLYVTRNGNYQRTEFRYQEMAGVGAFIWLEDQIGFAMIGDMPREALLQATKIAYESLDIPA